MAVQPVEEVDPEFAEILLWLVKQDRIYVEANGEVYVRALQVKTIPRNNLCPCGSGKKYKKCCGS